MITRSLFQKIGMMAAIGLAAASCSQDEFTGNRSVNSNAVSFGIIASSNPAGDTPETRALNADDTPVMLLAQGGQDTLYLHPWVTENHSAPSAHEKKGMTRGVPVDKDNFEEVCQNFGVTAYTEDGKLFMQDEKISKASSIGLWSSDETYFWPADATLNFYAYAPYSNKPMTITDNKEITFNYTVPDEATDQPDIMFAHNACSKETSEGGTVPLEFKHALAGVKFVAKDVTDCTVKSITLKNLCGKGSCTYNTETKTFTWKLEDGAEKKDFSQKFNVTLEENSGTENTQLITDENEATTFMLIPQSLEGVTVEVKVETNEGETFTLTGSLTGEWEASHIYTYAISTESINWEYVFEVTDNITLALGETQKQYTVTSYRQRKGDSSIKEAVAWRAENKNFSETNQETGSTITDITLGDILSNFTYEGDAPTEESADYGIELTKTTLHTDYKGDQDLKNSPKKGSPENPYDLSTEGGTMNQTTANCYVVDAAGTYMLPLVYGNAIKNGSTNSAAYSGGSFKDYKDQVISGPNISGADDAVLIWSDGFFMFKDIRLSENKDYLIFTIDSDYMQQANAVLAVRDASDQIMWSWHIWVTERPINETLQVTDYSDSGIKYDMMKCNLGWVDGKMVYYNERNLTFEFTQIRSGKTAQMTVKQEGAKFNYKDVGSTYYQWGRKDPLVALRNWDAYRFEDYRLHETGDPGYVYQYQTGPASLGTAIQHPNVFYIRGNDNVTDWNSEHIATLWNNEGNGGALNSTTSVKTIYDPSPRGFKVPVPRTFAIFVNGGTSTTTGGTLNGKVDPSNSHRYMVYPEPNKGGSEIPLTATGQRADRAGLEAYLPNDGKGEIGGLWSLYGVYYWTCIQEKSASAYTLVIRKDDPSGIEVYSYGFGGAKTMARPVRPVKETN